MHGVHPRLFSVGALLTYTQLIDRSIPSPSPTACLRGRVDVEEGAHALHLALRLRYQ